LEKSSDQVVKPVYQKALTSWFGKIPTEIVEKMSVIAPMLGVFGYDVHLNGGNYSYPLSDNFSFNPSSQPTEQWLKFSREILHDAAK